mgnify:CR=1 FL=1
MKKNSFFVMLFPIFFMVASCGTTANVAQTPQSPEAAVTQKQEDIANEIADTMNAAAPQAEIPPETENIENSALAESEEPSVSSEITVEREENSENELSPEESTAEYSISNEENTTEEPETSEKVSEEDSNFDKERENAPTTDERGKVSEYPIFEEPEVVVLDLPDEEPQREEAKSEEIVASNNEETVKSEEVPAPKAEEVPAPNAENSPKAEIAPLPKNEAAEAKTEAPVPQKAEETAESAETEEKASEESEEIVPSRSVAVKINQFLDVTYPGKGWTYIGETEKNALFTYSGRKIGSNNTTFSLRAKKAGNTLLHFYKNDALTGEYIDDYLSVTVEAKRSAGRVKAPAYADIVPAKPQRRIDRANENQKEAQQAQTAEPPQTPQPVQTGEAKAAETAPASKNEKTTQNTASQWSAQSQKNAQNARPSPSQNANTHANSESDVKTVIQTTDKTVETTPQARESQEYTPISSQSETVSVPTNTETELQEDPWTVSNQVSQSEKSEVDESLLEKAKKDFVDGKFEDALKEAQEYYNSASTRLDEALFLLGQISESNSSVKDIRFAVDSYDMLVKRFPASKYWKQAKNRSIYLKRFYIDIR